MNEHASRGRSLIAAIIAVYFLLELLLISFETAVTDRLPDLASLLRLGLSVLLAYHLFMGRGWARWAWGILLLLGVLTGLALGASSPGAAGPPPVILLFSCAGLLYLLGSAVFLFLSPDIRAYLEYRSSRAALSHPSPGP